MGSYITLGLGRLEIDWGKNWLFKDHSKLFLPTDMKPVPHYYVNADEPHEPIIEHKQGYARSVASIVRRLELLGYTLTAIRRMYDETLAVVPDFYDDPELDFDLFTRAVVNVDVTKVELGQDHDDYDLGEYVAEFIMRDPEFTKTKEALRSLTRHDGTFFENLDPYIVLRLLAENPANLEREVEWRCADVIEAGWATSEDIYQGLQRSDRYLIVTEGSSDAAILNKAFVQLMPDVADFFTFIDMAENYPFTGTGNLFRFAQGLARISIQNKVLIVFDNDTAGEEAYARTMQLDLPPNMRVTKLPDLPEFRQFPTVGPSGDASVDINGRAAAIEVYLDHTRIGPPLIRWTAYNAKLGAYQGELENKELYAKDFLRGHDIPTGYDCSKLMMVLQHLYGVMVGVHNKPLMPTDRGVVLNNDLPWSNSCRCLQ